MTTDKDPMALRETLDTAAQAFHEANHLTLALNGTPGLEFPADAYLAFANLRLAAQYLPQLLGQLGDWLLGEYAAGKVASDTGEDAGAEVMEVSAALIRAASVAGDLEKALGDAHNASATLKAAG